MSIIYKIINKINNKFYIGKFKWDKNIFFKSEYYGSGKIIIKALKKYGKENFIREIIEECDVSIRGEREIYWIDRLDARNPEIGYNIAVGGNTILRDGDTLEQIYGIARAKKIKTKTSISLKRVHREHPEKYTKTEEIKQKIGLTQKGRKKSEEFKKRVSNTMKNKNYRGMTVEERYGKEIGNQFRKNISKRMVGKIPEAFKKSRTEHPEKYIKTEQSKKKVSEILKGHNVSEETKRKIVETRIKNGSYKQTEKTKQKISQTLKNRAHWKKLEELNLF